ncbi:hypothetical protein NE237_011149 [Protea cynaroides]|uniref:Uncharacterized protein n=1 Tax=Protea cynaroides TaxID=273540 RepID=A0A9Q0GUE8_9MAGN|nr:hypothetical protein NE237_011149 [Protea cynaroides]
MEQLALVAFCRSFLVLKQKEQNEEKGKQHTIVLRSVEPTATFGIDHDTKSGYETTPVSMSKMLRRSASNRVFQFSQELKAEAFSWGRVYPFSSSQNGAGDALAARTRRREKAALDRTKSGAHKAL